MHALFVTLLFEVDLAPPDVDGLTCASNDLVAQIQTRGRLYE
jgi:hypothetical protein